MLAPYVSLQREVSIGQIRRMLQRLLHLQIHAEHSSVPLPLFATFHTLTAALITRILNHAPNWDRSHGSRMLVK